MSFDEPKKIPIDASSIINLKAELLRKQEEYRLKKLTDAGTSQQNESAIRKQQVWDKKKKDKKVKDETTSEKANLNEEELKLLEKSRSMLEMKAQYYEQLTAGKVVQEQGDEELYLVDFVKKISETRQDEYIKLGDDKHAAIPFSYDKTDENGTDQDKKLNLKNTFTEEEYREQLHAKWQEEKIENVNKKNIHYADVKYDEIRNMGVGHYQFSRSEAERKQQMDFFQDLRHDALTNRVYEQIERRKREEAMKKRLRKVKQKRMLRLGYTLEEIEEKFREDEEKAAEEAAAQEAIEAAEIMEETEIEEGMKAKRPADTREWDKPKMREPIWNTVVKKLREERDDEFAPPEAYDKTENKKKRKIHEISKKEKFSKTEDTDEEINEKPTEPGEQSYATTSEQTHYYVSPSTYLPEFLQAPHLMPSEFFTSVPPPNILLTNTSAMFQSPSLNEPTLNAEQTQ